MQRLLLIGILLGLLVPAGPAHAIGGRYVFEGGSEEARAQVVAALDASSFDWDIVPGTITIRISRCGCAGASPGEIVLDEDVLTRSIFGPRYAWAIVQHEYAHQVDFLVLDARRRQALAARLGGKAWCWETEGFRHDEYGCERFATLVAWSYWPSRDNIQRPQWAPLGTTTAPRPATFRALLRGLADPQASLRRRSAPVRR